jgi:type IV pilus assembly protein PilV
MNLGRLSTLLREPRGCQRRGAKGFTLLEVLVSVVVLSFGVLGVVGLQAAALQANKDARYQSSASRLARELADMMRDNPTIALASGAGNPYMGTFSAPTVTPPAQNCYTTPCTLNPLALANFEVADWLTRVYDELPGAQVVVCSDTTPYGAGGKAKWACTGGAGAPIYIKIGWTRQGFNPNGDASTLSTMANGAPPSIVQAFVPG